MAGILRDLTAWVVRVKLVFRRPRQTDAGISASCSTPSQDPLLRMLAMDVASAITGSRSGDRDREQLTSERAQPGER